MTHRPPLALAGVPVRVDWRWLAVAVAVTAITVYSLTPDLTTTAALFGWYAGVLAGVLLAVTFLALHELAHIVMARRGGMQITAVEPAMFGALSDTAFAPVDPASEARVAAAGPVASVAIAGGCAAFAWATADRLSVVADIAWFLALANGAVAMLNLMPGYPFDGGRLLRSFAWYLSDDLVTGTRVAAFYGQLVLLFGFLAGFAMLAVGEPYAVWGAWLLLAFWPVSGAAREGVVRTIWRETGRRLTLDEAGMAVSGRMRADTTIDAGIDELLQARGQGPMLVVDEGKVIGVFSLARVRRVPRALWTERQIRDVTLPLDGLTRLDKQARVSKLFALFDDDPDRVVLVESQGVVTGALDHELALRRMRMRIADERRLRDTD